MYCWKNLWEEELVKIVELASIFAIFKGKKSNNILFRDGYSMDPLLPKK